jgi:hypothetical protein
MSAQSVTTVTLATVADVASALGVTGQAVSAWHKNADLATPVPAFQILPTYGRRQVELLWTQDQVSQWRDVVASLVTAQQAEVIAKAAKAAERAAAAQAKADKAIAAAAKLTAAAATDPDQLTLV